MQVRYGGLVADNIKFFLIPLITTFSNPTSFKVRSLTGNPSIKFWCLLDVSYTTERKRLVSE